MTRAFFCNLGIAVVVAASGSALHGADPEAAKGGKPTLTLLYTVNNLGYTDTCG
jgi:hypothetical protein